MRGIVALGDQALAHVAATYYRVDPCAIWVLGAQESPDLTLHSLEALLEPFMDAYFTGEGSVRSRAAVAALRAQPDLYGPLEIGEVISAAVATLDRSLASCMSLVEMLDRAHQLHPIDLVIVSTDRAPLPATAVAWAKARGVTSILLDSATLHDVRDPATDRVLAFGDRASTAYASIGIHESRRLALPHPKSSVLAQIVTHRLAYRARITQVQGWPETDALVAFEPDSSGAQTPADGSDSFEVSLRHMYAAYAFARERVPSLRLAIIPSQPVRDGMARSAKIGAVHGVDPTDVVYAETDGDIWTGIADIVVSRESSRSLDAAVAGIPAVNLWQAEDWYRGPAFGADDGIIETQVESLGSTIVALAMNRDISGQIAAIARERVRAFGFTAPELGTSDAAVRTAEALIGWRPRDAPAIHIERKLDIVICAPPYTHASAGIRALYRLCHFINVLGGNASMYPGQRVHPSWNTPRRIKNLAETSIVVYPETVFTPLPAKRVVRWVLNVPGLLGGAARYDDAEMVFYHTGFGAAAQRATAEMLTPERELATHTIEPELFYNDLSQPRLYDCVYIGKGEDLYSRFRPPEITNAFVIRRHENAWPNSRIETAAMLRGCRKLYIYDAHSAIREEAILCGVQLVTVGSNGELTEEDGGKTAYDQRHVNPKLHAGFLALAELYRQKYADTSHVERFMRLVEQRWG